MSPQTQQSPSLSDLFTQMLGVAKEQTRVCVPGKVVKKRSGNLVDVAPLIGSNDGLEDPNILQVPLMSYGSHRLQMTFPVRVGDPVLLIFADRDITDWRLKGGRSSTEARSKRTHDISDAIALPVSYDASLTGVELLSWLVDFIGAFDSAVIDPATYQFDAATKAALTALKLKLQTVGV